MENITNNLLNNYDISKISNKNVFYFKEFYRIIRFLSFEDRLSFKVKQFTNSSLILEKKIDSKSEIEIIRQRKLLLDLFNVNEYDLLSKMVNSAVFYENSRLLHEEEILMMEDPTMTTYTEDKYKELKYQNQRLYYNGFHTTDVNTSIIVILLYMKIVNDINNEIVEYHKKHNIRLNLYSMKIGNYEMEYLCDNINTMTNLRTLNLNGNDIEDEGLYFLSSHFKYISELETLYLNGNYISDVGISYFCDSCSILSKLKDLSLWKNNITDVGGELLSEYLQYCPELKQLWINDNNISNRDAIKEKIKKNHPNRQIIIN